MAILDDLRIIWFPIFFLTIDVTIYHLFALYSAKLRARQKERLAQRNAIERSCNVEEPSVTEPLLPFPPINAKDREQVTRLAQPVREKAPAIDLEDGKIGQPLDAMKGKADSNVRLGRQSRHKSHLDLSARALGHPSPDIFLPSHHYQGTSYTNLVANNLLPVLGLCAPNATQLESSHKNFSRSNGRQTRHGVGPEFPFCLAPCSGTSMEMDIKGHENASDKLRLLDASTDLPQLQRKNNNPDNCSPFGPVCSLSLSFSLSLSVHIIIVIIMLIFICSPLQLLHKKKVLIM